MAMLELEKFKVSQVVVEGKIEPWDAARLGIFGGQINEVAVRVLQLGLLEYCWRPKPAIAYPAIPCFSAHFVAPRKRFALRFPSPRKRPFRPAPSCANG
jgi:hypothetical protein